VEFFTLDRSYVKQNVIDKYISAIWTKRYYGDSEVELVVPTTSENTQLLPKGTFLGLVDDDELMILETREFQEDGSTKHTGISLLKWLNNRFFRIGGDHRTRYFQLGEVGGGGMGVEATFEFLLTYMVIHPTWVPMGITSDSADQAIFAVPGLTCPHYADTLPHVLMALPFGPLYDAMRTIAATYEVGMRLIFHPENGPTAKLVFDAYRGVDRTGNHVANPVRFSANMDSLTKIKELNSIAGFKTHMYVFAPGNPNDLSLSLEAAGTDRRISLDESYTGFDLRAQMVFAEDITTDEVGSSVATLEGVLDSRAASELAKADEIQLVDGQIVPDIQFKYGVDYNLGDIVEVEAPSSTITKARVTEYIRTQDKEGERSYPTLTKR
jgi:hypothetical protein